MRLTIRKKIYSTLVIILLFISALGWRGIVGMRDINKALNSIYYEQFIPARMAASANIALISWNRAILNHVLADSDERKDEYKRIMLDQRIAVTGLLEELSKTKNLSEKGKKLVRELQEAFKQADPIRDRVVALSRAGKQEEARELVCTELRPIVDQMGKDKTEFLLLQEKQLEEAMGVTDARYKQGVRRIFLFIGSVLVLTSIVVLFVSSAILKSVNELGRGMKRVAEGHFQQGKVNILSNDELGDLGAGFNQMAEKIEQSILEIARAQEELVRQEKFAVVGRLSGSIAHEIKNPLAVISSSVFYLKMKLKETDEKTRAHLDRIHNQVEISTNIIQNLQNLTKVRQSRKVRLLDLANVIEEGVALAGPPRGVEIVKEVKEGNLFVSADREQLAMVFKNLATNAVQAMDSRGTIWVSATETSDGQCEIRFKDSGPGIEAYNLERIFEPLFSTGARGMGFGLAICRMIIEKHGGTIEAQSKAGEGATFIVGLPSFENRTGVQS